MPSVPVAGSERDLRRLAGEWVGEFASSRSVRTGAIAFSLKAGRDTAEGRVVFTGPMPLPGCTDPVSTITRKGSTGEIVLTFARIDVDDASVGGWLRPHRDPDLGCQMDTWFQGTIQGDTLSGLYFSHPADTAASVRLGTWWVARQR